MNSVAVPGTRRARRRIDQPSRRGNLRFRNSAKKQKQPYSLRRKQAGPGSVCKSGPRRGNGARPGRAGSAQAERAGAGFRSIEASSNAVKRAA